MRSNIILATTLVFFSTACGYTQSVIDGDETGGDSKPNQSPSEIENPPQWHCKERIPIVTLVAAIPQPDQLENAVLDAHEAEVCAYAVSTDLHDPVPPKPYWRGLPDMFNDYLAAFNNFDLAELGEEDPAFNLHPNFVRRDFDYVNPGDWYVTGAAEERSGLIGNFAFWMNEDYAYLGSLFSVPDSGHRPPIVTGTIFDLFADVIGELPLSPPWSGTVTTTGRYTAYGIPCNTKDPSFDYSTTPLVRDVAIDYQRHEDAECAAFVMFDEIMQAHTLYPFEGMNEAHAYTQAEVRAFDAAACLDNGGEYLTPAAALTSGERNGLIWVNWTQIDSMIEFLQSTFSPDVQEAVNDALIFLDWLESQGWSWNLWPLNPAWPWSNWSFTGVCAHPVQLSSTAQGEIRTRVPCPRSYIPVVPDFNPPDPEVEDYPELDWRVDGYCTLPMQIAPMESAINRTLAPQIKIGKQGHGFSGAIYVEPMTPGTLELLSNSLSLTKLNDAPGISIGAKDGNGEELLSSMNVPVGSVVVGTNLNIDSADPTVNEMVAGVDNHLARGQIVMLLLDDPNGKRLHRYIVPTPTPPAIAREDG